MNLINMTAHDITVFSGDSAVLTLAPDGGVARLREIRSAAFVLTSNDQIPIEVEDVRYSGLETDLPSVVPGTYYIVSRLTAHELSTRNDVLFPLDEVRDSTGAIVGCRALGRLADASASLLEK
jgi:hypothetical protein